MNFFENQDKARKKTSILVFYFILAIACIILAVDLLLTAAIVIVQTQNKPMMPMPQIIHWFTLVFTYVSPGVIAVILLGTLISFIRLRGGGISVAEMVNARPLDYATTDFLEKRLINVVEEMSIASGAGVPKLYIMDEEPGINAFVAGIKPSDTVMVVTKGALESLRREEIQGVIGHEYSHILNSDMLISVRLIAILAGVLMISQLGYNVIRFFGTTRSRSSDRSNANAVFLFVGIGILIIGYIGLFFGRLIKASISRQRELLADASSVAYTRNPQGLVNALRRIQDSDTPTLLKNKHAEDVSHLCFSPSTPVFLTSLLATHPPLDVRISTLDPDGMYTSSPLTSLRAEETQTPPPSNNKATATFTSGIMMGAAVMAGAQNTISGHDITKTIGQLTQDNLTYAQNLIRKIPQNLLDYAHDPQKVGYLLLALILPKSADKLNNMISQLDKPIPKEDLDIITMLHSALSGLNLSVYLPLMDMALPSFKQKPLADRQDIFNKLEKMTSTENQDLFDFVLLASIGKAVEEPNSPNRKMIYNSYSDVLPELTMLISLIVSFNHESENQQELFQKVMTRFTSEPQMISKVSLDTTSLRSILSKINQLTPLYKEEVIHAAIDCIESDNKITLEEAELVRGIAACLDCPIPPIVPTDENAA